LSDNTLKSNDLINQDERKLIINVTYKCNNHCIFCSIADRPILHGDFDAQIRHIDKAYDDGVRLLDIDGGEPTLYPRLFDLLDYAIEKGMERVTITTNGRYLSDPKMVKRLASYPIALLVSLHAGDAEVHERLTTQKGSFKQTVRGIMQALKYFPDLGVNTTIISENMYALEKCGRLIAKLGVKMWNIQHYTPFGEVDPQLAPDPYATGKELGKVISIFKDAMKINVINLPFCFVEGYEDYALKDINKAVRNMLFVSGELVNLSDFLAEKRFKNGKCEHCKYSEVCKGFWDYGNNPETGKPYLIRMLDVIPGYPCSAKCIFCAVEDNLLDKFLNTEEVKAEISRAMAYGPELIRFGGGEPTDRDDLAELISYANHMQIETISVQTHGFKLADKEYLKSLVDAGANKFNISIRGGDKATHEMLVDIPDSFEKVVSAIENVVEYGDGVQLELDGILTSQTIGTLKEQVKFYHSLGAEKFNYWFVTAEGRARDIRDSLVPDMMLASRKVKEAAEYAEQLGIEHFRCYYIPYCFFKGQEKIVWHPLEENALVITPGSRFTLDKGTLDLGVKVDKCTECAIAKQCFGISPSYVKYYGDKDIAPYDRVPQAFKEKEKE